VVKVLNRYLYIKFIIMEKKKKFQDVDITTEEMEIMQIDIMNGIKKEDSRVKLDTKYKSDFWDEVLDDINENVINKPNTILDIRP